VIESAIVVPMLWKLKRSTGGIKLPGEKNIGESSTQTTFHFVSSANKIQYVYSAKACSRVIFDCGWSD
jgi:hypothetical protein